MRGAAPATIALGFVLAATVPTGCADSDPLAPPKIYYGEDVCTVCGMIISDERFAAAAVTRSEEESPNALFDDVGCLLAFEEEIDEGEILVRYVRGYESRAWLDMAGAVFVHSRQLKTPMAFGVAACATAETAEAVRRDHPGDVLDLAALRDRFRAGDLTIIPD